MCVAKTCTVLGIDRENKEMKKRQTQIEKLGRAGPACSDVPAAWKLSTDCGGRFIIYSRTRGKPCHSHGPGSGVLGMACSCQPYTHTQDFTHSAQPVVLALGRQRQGGLQCKSIFSYGADLKPACDM